MLLFITLLASSIVVFLGFIVYFHDSENTTNRIFFVHTLVTAIGALVNYVSVTIIADQSLFWIRLVLFFAVPHVFLLFFFVTNFPKVNLAISKKNLFYMLGLMAVLMGLTLTPFVFREVIISNGKPLPVTGSLMDFFAPALVIIVIVTFVMMFRKYIHSQGVERRQWRAISAGLITTHAMLIALIFLGVVIFKDTRFVTYSPFFIMPMFLSTAYAILRFRFLNVKVVTTELLAFFVLFVSVWQILLTKDFYLLVLQAVTTILLLFFSVLLVRSVLREVNQRQQLEALSQQLEYANKQLLEVDQAKSEFLSVASHQLRTPLTAIKGYASMLLDGDFGQMSPVQKDTLKTVYDSAQRLVSLVMDLLDLSRIEAGSMQFDFGPVDLCTMVESILKELKQKAESKHLYLFFDNVHSSCPLVRADSEKIRQVLINLIDNAIKYTVEGGVTIRFNIVENKLQLSVADTGIGIDPKDQPKLFQKFFRSEAASTLTQEGTGLGIYVVKKMVEAHKGQIWFESPGAGKGSTFYVTLPIPDGQIKEERVKISALEAL